MLYPRLKLRVIKKLLLAAGYLHLMEVPEPILPHKEIKVTTASAIASGAFIGATKHDGIFTAFCAPYFWPRFELTSVQWLNYMPRCARKLLSRK